MQWLLDLIAKHTKDGVLDTESLTKEINAEFPKHAVPKSEFNDINELLKTANNTIKDLKEDNAENETLQNTIKEHEKTIQKLQEDATNTSKTYALKEQLSKSGVVDPDYLIYKQGGLEKFNFDKEGKPIGIEDVLKPMKEDKTLAHLFQTGKNGTEYNPAGGGNYTGKNPFAKETFNLTEQGKLLRDNPVQAKELAAAAGYKL
ncbi:phage scaffolding protein [Anaerocolumna sp.]|uniref:phage scaffolding protein n=1 Tax=Anaerocolumna sp. TaxID=2041569 RepID=UPI0028B1DF7B|nr:phage scaffolding protein [Anaerocolumna sp.]